ncbi:MAG TPA: sigma 54-interacting transcriptional regulator [Bryobacteraceae bacterium]|nr:sigma 54-interacting transcriptional regulator [Bryobacteraceae bacterium]
MSSATMATWSSGVEENHHTHRAPVSHVHGMIGTGTAMRGVLALIERIAPYFTTVLVTGETGTGKELAAKALHDLSPGRRGQYVVLNCSAVVETLFESELFGHVRGAFTGAQIDKTGLIEFANGGTLFLDEIGDMPLATQAKLLRVIQSREVQRVGSLNTRKVDIRIVAATNKDLRKAVAEKTFREDLFYRLSMVDVHLPPLRDRFEDLQELTDHFVRLWSQRLCKSVDGISNDVRKALRSYDWPGNIRELENVIGHACMIAHGPLLEMSDFPEYMKAGERLTPSAEQEAAPIQTRVGPIESMEIRLIRQALSEAGGNQLKAARLLRINRDKLRYRMKKYGLLSRAAALSLSARV